MIVSFPHIETKQQITLLCKMASVIWKEAYRDLLSPAQIAYMLDLFFNPSVVDNQISEEHYVYHFITADGITAGFFGVQPRLKENSLFLSKIYLLQKFRGKGLFGQAMHKIIGIARENGLPVIRLQVNKNNTVAINAYIRSGFYIAGSDVFDIGSGYVMDDYIMEYVISR